jgi:hypothetical protein
MDTGALDTTNLMLGIMAAVSVLEALLIIGLGIVGWKAYSRVMEVVNGIEARHIAPAMTRVNAMLDDVKRVTSTVKEETDRVDHAIHRTIDRVDETAERMAWTLRSKTSRLVGFIRGARVAIETLLADGRPGAPPMERRI